MTQTVLVKIIMTLCSSYLNNSEVRLQCMEYYVNCSVYSNGKIDIKRCQRFKEEENGND